MFNLYVPYMFTLNFARRHRHFIWHTHYFFIWLANEEEFSGIIPHGVRFLSQSLQFEPKRLKFNLNHVFSVLREFLFYWGTIIN